MSKTGKGKEEDDSFKIILAAIAGTGIVGVVIAIFLTLRR